MKKLNYIFLALSMILFLGACEQELIVTTPPEPDLTNITPDPCDGSAGSANFTKFVAIGNSFVAGFQAGALFNDGQASSMAKIIAKQLECVGGLTTFNQPDINSQNGYNVQLSVPGVITLGRLVLFDPDGAGPRTAAPSPAGFPGSSVTCPAAVTTPPLPAPYNTADLPTAFAGNKAELNNFGVPLIYLGQSLIPDTGNPASPYYNPLWARFASQPGVKSIMQDALTAGGSFYLFWLGMDDVLLYAAGGADNAGAIQMTSEANFNGQYNGAIAAMLTGTTLKGVVGNIPNFTTLPYFYTVAWNQITLDASTAGSLTTNLANNYNAFLAGMVGAGVINENEKANRMLTYVVGKNGVLLTDEDLTDLSPYMVGPYAGLAPYARARQAKSVDLIPLSAGSVLGTCFGGSPNAIIGVSYPVSDKHALTPNETTAILTRTAAFNAVISTAVSGSADRLALADVNKAYGDFVTAKFFISNNVTITPSFPPPTGAFSEDGLHPNIRGYAFTANVFIDAINKKFGSTIPLTNFSKYQATALPIIP